MRLLVITQVVDRNDPGTSFFHRWLEEFAARFESIEVICLKEGAHELPANVRVHSLGKEAGRQSRAVYAMRLFRQLRKIHGSYDAVFVHQNQEYLLLAGLYWCMIGSSVCMWRNHYAGNLLTDIAAFFCTKIFCTSRASYTAKYRKTVLMPVGVDTDFFKKSGTPERDLLSLGRIAPSKRLELLIDALAILRARSIYVTCSIYGDALREDQKYHTYLKEKVSTSGLTDAVSFFPGVPNYTTPALYSAHRLFINLSESGMYDKTILEAAACESVVLATSNDFSALVGEKYVVTKGSEELAQKIETFLALPDTRYAQEGARLRELVVSNHSLSLLGKRLVEEMQG